jgi:Ser-tRNA(Ala) deacylase AlaX
MSTRKLYYEDSHQRAFSATVLSCQESPKGYLVTLDATFHHRIFHARGFAA